VLNFSTPHVITEQSLVDPSLDLSLSHDDLLDVLCDQDELVDNASILHTLEPTTIIEHKRVQHIVSVNDELKLLSSLHTLGYIEFDNLCNLDCLEEKLFTHADLPWFTNYTYHVIGQYDNNGQYMIHRVYICENLSSPFVVHNFDPLEDNCTKIINPRSSSYVFMKQVYSEEGEPYWLLPMPAWSFVGTNLVQEHVDKHYVSSDQEAYMLAKSMRDDTFTTWKYGDISTLNTFGFLCFRNPVLLCVVQGRFQVKSTPRTAFRQEGEDDEDMTHMHLTINESCISEEGVQQGCQSHEGGSRQIQFESPRWKPKQLKFESVRGSGAAHDVLVAPATYGVRFGRSTYGWKSKKITFPMAPVSCLNSIRVNGNRREKWTSRICQKTAPMLLGRWPNRRPMWALGYCSRA
jgi:hypothetical protein